MSDSDFPEEATLSEVRSYALTPRVLLSTAGLGVGLGVALGILMTMVLCTMCCMHWREIKIFGTDDDDDDEELAEGHLPRRHSRSASRIVRFIADEDLQKLLEERKTDHDRKVRLLPGWKPLQDDAATEEGRPKAAELRNSAGIDAAGAVVQCHAVGAHDGHGRDRGVSVRTRLPGDRIRGA
eukprot:scaffold362_cov246-Pinguiococcus_pyrenoidosus.AAC.9